MNKNYLGLFISSCIFLPLLWIGIMNIWDVPKYISFLACVGIAACIILTGAAVFDPGGLTNMTTESKPPRILRGLRALLILLAIVFILPWHGAATFYNKTVQLSYAYEQKTQELPVFYDAMWKIYEAKKDLVDSNKQAFIQITGIIMDARKDGQSLAWKWVNENTQIPFGEFTKFYSDLSEFIEGRRDGLLNLERDRQQIAQEYNTMIHQFPNNLYNSLINRHAIQYEPGFTSEKTREVFRTKTE